MNHRSFVWVPHSWALVHFSWNLRLLFPCFSQFAQSKIEHLVCRKDTYSHVCFVYEHIFIVWMAVFVFGTHQPAPSWLREATSTFPSWVLRRRTHRGATSCRSFRCGGWRRGIAWSARAPPTTATVATSTFQCRDPSRWASNRRWPSVAAPVAAAAAAAAVAAAAVAEGASCLRRCPTVTNRASRVRRPRPIRWLASGGTRAIAIDSTDAHWETTPDPSAPVADFTSATKDWGTANRMKTIGASVGSAGRMMFALSPPPFRSLDAIFLIETEPTECVWCHRLDSPTTHHPYHDSTYNCSFHPHTAMTAVLLIVRSVRNAK